jgi:2-methylisocitrate lyase-like PEP mutase family enzyme
MSDAQQAARRFRALHERDGLFVMPNPWDAGTAKLLEHLGFEAIATASAALAVSLGTRDGRIGRHRSIEHAHLIVNVTALPVNGDLENGYGDAPEEVALTIRQAIGAGLAGCSIEDATGDPAKPLYDRDLAVERIRAAREAVDAAGSPFVLTARCEAFLSGHEAPLKECLERLSLMADAGADIVYACGMSAPDDIAALVREVPVPVNVIGGTGKEKLSLAALQDLGVKRVSLGPRLCQAAMGAFMRAAREVRESGTFAFMAEAAPLGPIYDAFGGEA